MAAAEHVVFRNPQKTGFDGDFRSVTWAALGQSGLCPDGFALDTQGARIWPVAFHNWLAQNLVPRPSPHARPPLMLLKSAGSGVFHYKTSWTPRKFPRPNSSARAAGCPMLPWLKRGKNSCGRPGTNSRLSSSCVAYCAWRVVW